MNSDEKNNAENQDEIAVPIREISKAITVLREKVADACHVNPDALSTPSSAFIGRMSKLKTAALAPTAVRCFSPHRNCLWAAQGISGVYRQSKCEITEREIPKRRRGRRRRTRPGIVGAPRFGRRRSRALVVMDGGGFRFIGRG